MFIYKSVTAQIWLTCLQQLSTAFVAAVATSIEPKDNQIYLRVLSLLLGFPAFELGTKKYHGNAEGGAGFSLVPRPLPQRAGKG